MKITAISDLHGYYPKLPGGDLLIIAGDLTARDTFEENVKFREWFQSQKYIKRIFIGGNHDNFLENNFYATTEYLCNSGIEYQGLKIWGSPNSLYFYGVNPHCTAFMKTEQELAKIYAEIPDDIDILITHTPPYGILDEVQKGRWTTDHTPAYDHCGSKSLLEVLDRIKTRYHFFGHIHENYGYQYYNYNNIYNTHFYNCSYVNERYQPVNEQFNITI